MLSQPPVPQKLSCSPMRKTGSLPQSMTFWSTALRHCRPCPFYPAPCQTSEISSQTLRDRQSPDEGWFRTPCFVIQTQLVISLCKLLWVCTMHCLQHCFSSWLSSKAITVFQLCTRGFLLLGISLDNDSDWPGWLVFEAVFACIFVAEIVIKSVASRPEHAWSACNQHQWCHYVHPIPP